MISDEQVARIRHLFHAEHWKIGTIAAELHLHPDTVRTALDTDRFRSQPRLRDRLTDPYLDFLRQTLQQYPRLRATRLLQMIRSRGYPGSITQLRRVVAELRPPQGEAFLRLRTFPGEQAQADWAHFGEVTIGRARRRLSGFVLTLSYSRALWLEFFLDQTLENFLLGHVHAFADWGGASRTVLTDNLRSVVLERRGEAIHFHPRFLELSAHYHFATRPCRPARGPWRSPKVTHVCFLKVTHSKSTFGSRDLDLFFHCGCQLSCPHHPLGKRAELVQALPHVCDRSKIDNFVGARQIPESRWTSLYGSTLI